MVVLPYSLLLPYSLVPPPHRFWYPGVGSAEGSKDNLRVKQTHLEAMNRSSVMVLPCHLLAPEVGLNLPSSTTLLHWLWVCERDS